MSLRMQTNFNKNELCEENNEIRALVLSASNP